MDNLNKVVNDDEEILEKIEKNEKLIKRGEEIRVEANTNIKNLQEQYRTENKKLTDLGIDPKKEEEEITNIENEINDLLDEMEKEIPTKLIENYDSNSETFGLNSGDDPF